MIKIIIADDHAVVRSGFAMILDKQIDMKVLATAADAVEAYRLAGELVPDVLVTDISMPPGESGLGLINDIAQNIPQVKTIALTMFDEQEYLSRALKCGAAGYILKNSSDEELIGAIRTVYKGGVYIDPSMMPGFVGQYREGVAGEDTCGTDLSEKETEIVALVAYGYSNKEIAERLFMSVKTVESQKARIMKKLGLASRPELVEYALKHRILH